MFNISAPPNRSSEEEKYLKSLESAVTLFYAFLMGRWKNNHKREDARKNSR